jgi:predicted RND superfamily exporter protein
LNAFSNSVIKHKRLVTVFFAVLAIVCLFLSQGVTVNYNVSSYLPADANSTVALEVMSAEFTQAMANARVMVKNVTLAEALDYKARLAAIDGVSNVTWLDDVLDLKRPIEIADPATVETYYKDNSALISVTVRRGEEARIMNEIYDLIGEDGAVAGDAVYRYSGQSMAGRESMNATFVAIPVILVILLLATGSWLEPLLFLAAIGVAVFMNMGTNLLLGEVSFVTSSVSPILQLAVSLDYAIFLLSSFADYREKTDDVTEAMRLAMRRSLSTVSASALTTFFGFTALCFMEFGIGPDLGINLAKGIILSFVSVMIFLPALTLCCYKLIDKTKHKPILPKFEHIGKFFVKLRVPALILAVLAVVPSFLAQNSIDFAYGTGGYAPGTRSYTDQYAMRDTFGSSMPLVLLVPRGDVAREAALSRELRELPHVTGVLSYAVTVGQTIPTEYVDEEIVAQFYSENYARLIVSTDTEEEGAVAFAVVEAVRDTAAGYYDTVYAVGESVSLYDVMRTVRKDNVLVNWLAILAIAIVLLLTFRSATLPIILVLTIEISIWINISVAYFTGSRLFYIGYLIISTVQLGATVDYAILFTDHYKQLRRVCGRREALQKTYGETFKSILISTATLALAGGTLWLTSSNPVVKTLGMLLARGTALSMLMVCCVLPALLFLLDKLVRVTTLKADFHRELIKKEKAQ